MSSQATGGSAMKAVEVLIEHGVPEERIIFINLVRTFTGQIQSLAQILTFFCSQIASPEGLTTFCAKYPSLKVVRSGLPLTHLLSGCSSFPQVTGWIDQGLNEKAYIIPGLGDFGERRFATYPSRFSN